MFDQHYEVLLADTPKSKAIHYGIRYQVYCEEMGFENKADFPQEQEFDHYDDHAAHFIVRTKQILCSKSKVFTFIFNYATVVGIL